MGLTHFFAKATNKETGRPLDGVIIELLVAGVPQQIYSDRNLTPKPQMVTGLGFDAITGANLYPEQGFGEANCYVEEGNYDIRYTFNGEVIDNQPDFPVFGSNVYTQMGGTPTTIQERLRREVWAEDFMTLPATGDQTVAFDLARDELGENGGTIRFNGEYTIGTTNPFRLPAEPKTVYLYGEGGSILRQGAANAPMIAKVAGTSRVIGAHMKGFTVVAHVDSLKATATNILVNIAGMDWSEIDIQYKSNSTFTSTNGRAYAVISGHANGIPCYNNKIRLEMQQTAGPEKGVWLHNNGGTSLANANVNSVSVWAYALDGCTVAIDASDSTQTLVHDSLFEDCPGMTGLLAGNFTKSRSNWYELIGTAINFTKTANTTANNCVSEHDQFSGSNTIVIHSDVAAPPRFEAPLFGSMTFNNQSAAATTNYIVPTLAKAQPATPSVSFAVGGGALSGNSSSTRHRVDHHGVTTLEASYIVTAPVVGRSVFRFAPPSGFEIEQASVAAAATGAAPIVGGLSAAATGTDYEIWFPTTADHVIYTRVTLRATFP